MKENQISIFSGKMLFFQKLFKIRCNQNPVSHQILFRLICQGLEIFTVKNDALWDKSIFRMACTASKIMCLVFGVTVWGNPQIVRLQKRFAVEFSPVVRKRSFLKKSMKPELCAVRVFFFQITAAFHFFAIRPPSAICSDHNICLLSFCPCGKGTYGR